MIASYLTAESRYGFTELPISMFAKDGTILAPPTRRSSSPRPSRTSTKTGKPGCDLLTYTYADGNQRDVINWRRQKTITHSRSSAGSRRLGLGPDPC